jgi:hypothetical protein
MAQLQTTRYTRALSYANSLTYRLSDALLDSAIASFERDERDERAVPYDDDHSDTRARPFQHRHKHTHYARINTTHDHSHWHGDNKLTRNHHSGPGPRNRNRPDTTDPAA